MKKILKFSLLLILMSCIGFYACSDDDDDPHQDAEQAKQELDIAVNTIKGNFDNIVDAEAIQAVLFIAELDPDFPKIAPLLKNIANPISFSRGFIKPKEDDFDFDWGIYTYNFATNSFDRIDHPNNLITIYFPATQTAYDSQNNNGILDLTQYTDANFGDHEEIPTSIKANMKVDGNTVFTLDYSGSFYVASGGDLTPSNISLTVNMTPFSLTASFVESGSNYIGKLNFKEGSAIYIDIDITAETNSSYPNPFDEAPDKIRGHIQVTPLKFSGYVNLFVIVDADSDDVNFINNNINVALNQTVSGIKIGDLAAKVFVYDTYENIEPVIIFADGSYQKLEDIFKPIFDDIEDLFD